jgi:large subunit ribosomal protein L21
MFAVIKTGGKQYIVSEGRTLKVELLAQEPGAELTFEPLLVANEDGTDVKVGQPIVAGAKVMGKVVEHGRGEKISVIKFKRKVRYRRNVGHRQPFTLIEITKIA